VNALGVDFAGSPADAHAKLDGASPAGRPSDISVYLLNALNQQQMQQEALVRQRDALQQHLLQAQLLSEYKSGLAMLQGMMPQGAAAPQGGPLPGGPSSGLSLPMALSLPAGGISAGLGGGFSVGMIPSAGMYPLQAMDPMTAAAALPQVPSSTANSS